MGGSSAQPQDIWGANRRSRLERQAYRHQQMMQIQRDIKQLHECCARWVTDPTQEEEDVLRLMEHIRVTVYQNRTKDDHLLLQRSIEDAILPPLERFGWNLKQFGPSKDTLGLWQNLYHGYRIAQREVNRVYGPWIEEER